MASDERIRELIKNRMQDVSSSCLVTSCCVWLKVRDLMSTEVATVGPEQTMAFAAMLMADEGLSSLVVVDNGSVVGIITEKNFLERVVAKGRSAVDIKVREVMSSPVISVRPEMTVLEAGQVVEERHVKRLPVIEDNKLVGIVTQTDLIRVLTSYGMWRGVEEIMTRDVATIQRDSSVADAAALMASRGISGIVVAQDKKIVGVLTERDLLKRVIAAGKDPANVTVGEVMTTPVAKIPPYYSVFSASRIMEKGHIRRLVVEDNKWLCGVVTQTDIFRAVEDKWREEETKNVKALEESDACIYTLDLDGKITYINPAFLRLLEAGDKLELIGRQFLPDEFWADRREKDKFAKETKKETVVVSDMTLKTAGGKRVDVTVYCSATKNIHCQVDGRQGVVRDVTAQRELVALREAQKALTASEERYRRISEAVTDYIYTVRFSPGRSAEPIHSEASTAITGYSPEEFKANPTLWLDIVYPEDLEVVREQVSRCICGQDFGAIEHRIVRKDGNIRWIRRTLVPNFNLEGKLLSYDGLLQDITDLKTAEQVQMQLLGELDQATEELHDFTYIASQDLRASKIERSDYGEKLEQDSKGHIIKTLLGRVKRMHNLLDGMLYCSHFAGREKATKVDLNEVVKEVMGEVAAEDNIQVVVENKLPVVECGRKGIRHIFNNLISNAVNFINKSDGRIAVNCVEEEDGWKFSVADNGPSMDEKTFGRIFKMPGAVAASDGCDGTGVGLTIVKKIVEFQGGRLWGRSKPGEGNVFYFTWPGRRVQEQVSPVNAVVAANLRE